MGPARARVRGDVQPEDCDCILDLPGLQETRTQAIQCGFAKIVGVRVEGLEGAVLPDGGCHVLFVDRLHEGGLMYLSRGSFLKSKSPSKAIERFTVRVGHCHVPFLAKRAKSAAALSWS